MSSHKDEQLYWVWLQQALGIASGIKTDEIKSYFGSARALYFAGDYEWRISGLFNDRQLSNLHRQDLSNAGNTIEVCLRNGWKVVTPCDGDYPSMLFKLPDFPLALYVKGNLDCLKNKISVAMVGTRRPSRNSASVARSLSSSLTRSGALVVSGGALGIDSASHRGALDAKGKTIAVLGCGLDINYPASNRGLREEISANGAVITEYPPGTAAIARNFPVRNRIISGLCYGTVVIEAGERSGSLITAGFALEQGRDVFAVPGDIMSTGFTGTNKLIRDGASPVFNALDILEEYALSEPQLLDIGKIEKHLTLKNYADPPSVAKVQDNPPKTQKGEVTHIKTAEPPLLSENARKIYRAFDKETMQTDEIILKTGLSVSDFASAITELELFDIVELQPGKIYKFKN